MQALVLQSGVPGGSGGATWLPSEDEKEILNTPGENLIFVDSLKYPDAYGYRNVKQRPPVWEEQLKLDLEGKYPNVHPHLPRVEINNEQVWEDEKYVKRLVNVCVLPKSDTEYRENDAEAACELAKQFGQVSVRYFFGITRGGYDAHTSILEEAGCYYRNGENGGEVVYNPKVVERRLKRQETVRKTGGRSVPYLTINELTDSIESLVKLLQSAGVINRWTTWPWKGICCCNRRTNAVEIVYKTLDTFNMVYGENAHRHMPEFQDWLRGPWKLHGEATKKSFGHERIFDFFDYELTVRKPGKRKHSLEGLERRRQIDCRTAETRKQQAEDARRRKLEQEKTDEESDR